MDKNKGIWIVIGSILVIGILVTVMTASFVRKEAGGEADMTELAATENQTEPPASSPDAPKLYLAGQEQLSSAPAGKADAGPMERSAKPGMLSEAPLSKKPELASENGEAPAGVPQISDAGEYRIAPASQEEAEYDEAAQEDDTALVSNDGSLQIASENGETELMITPLSPSTKRTVVLEYTDAASYYEKHLAELDAQIRKMRGDAGDSTTYSMKALADKELRMWGIELNDIYAVISDGLDVEAREKLEVSQQDWIKSRDAKAREAGKKYSGGSLEGVEYTASLAESTRSRAYDLVSQYEDILAEAQVQ